MSDKGIPPHKTYNFPDTAEHIFITSLEIRVWYDHAGPWVGMRPTPTFFLWQRECCRAGLCPPATPRTKQQTPLFWPQVTTSHFSCRIIYMLWSLTIHTEKVTAG